MKKIIFIFFLITSVTINAQSVKADQKTQIVEVSCGQCKFNMTEKNGCDLAVLINGKSYFIEGTHIDAHGDAHANDGFCEVIRKAEVKGELINDKFVVTFFKLLPIDKK